MKFLKTSIITLSIATTSAAMAMKPVDLRCEYTTDPIAVQVDGTPRLSWVVDGEGNRGVKQTAYRILAASSPELLIPGKADLWDSEKVSSDATIGIEYAGKRLKSFDRAYWKVMLWDKDGAPTTWSPVAQWKMGALNVCDWDSAKWIALRSQTEWKKRWDAQKAVEAKTADPNAFPLRNYGYWSIWDVVDTVKNAYDASPLMRREFKVGKKVDNATLYICGLGYFEASINGKPVSEDVLNPAWTNYDTMPLYCTYDVTDMLSEGGKNVIGVMLGRGQYNPIANDGWRLNQSGWVDQPKLIAMLKIKYADGSEESVVTDRQWR
ncbi:MAG: alpha-L-rhamnosidase N-terminal domain-containing protein, partial [Muribaculum sp.]|nr:alpha-L-rhamnosidase N-terminal domain-containing protein [Muribaculum sp.]